MESFVVIVLGLLCHYKISYSQIVCPVGYSFFEDFDTCLPECLSNSDPRDPITLSCLWIGDYSIPYGNGNNHCERSIHCQSGNCICKYGEGSDLCLYGLDGFIANDEGVCADILPCLSFTYDNTNLIDLTSIKKFIMGVW